MRGRVITSPPCVELRVFVPLWVSPPARVPSTRKGVHIKPAPRTPSRLTATRFTHSEGETQLWRGDVALHSSTSRHPPSSLPLPVNSGDGHAVHAKLPASSRHDVKGLSHVSIPSWHSWYGEWVGG